MNENTLIVMVGIPRSGKTTWARRQGFPIVSPDAVRIALHGKPFIPSAEGLVWAMTRVFVRALFLAGHRVVILDATSITEEQRNAWTSKRWGVRYRFIDTPVEECLRRAKDGGRPDLVPVIKKMVEKATAPPAGLTIGDDHVQWIRERAAVRRAGAS